MKLRTWKGKEREMKNSEWKEKMRKERKQQGKAENDKTGGK